MPNGKANIGQLEKVNLRDIWGDEARDFTPWLASPEGLNELKSAIGFGLELIKTEVAVGPYYADILAKSSIDDDHKVIIENQLGKTDHDHLGKIITYAAGVGAKTLIWISDRFCDEHRAAIDWLNYNTGEGIAFYGLEIRAFRIDNSRAAPQFWVVSSPNAQAKAAREKVASVDKTPSVESLRSMGAERHVENLVNILLKLAEGEDYVTAKANSTYGGSFRCWRTDIDGTPRIVMGINVAGTRKQTPDGQIDVWLPIPTLASVAGISIEDVRSALSALPTLSKESVDWIIRVKNENEAEALVAALADFFQKHPGRYADEDSKPS